MRSEKVITNSIWGMAYKMVTILLGFIGRTVFIQYLGPEYLGISGLFSNILSMLSLSELGFSTAITFHLYKVLAQNDQETITGIMNFYKVFYRIIAAFIAVVGTALIPFLPHIMAESTFSIEYVSLVYAISLFKIVVSYLFSYNFTLIIADQKQYMITKIDIVMHIVMSCVNILSLILFRNYIVYLAGEILLVILSNILKSVRVWKTYPYLKEKHKISKQKRKAILSDVKNIFAGKVATVVVTSTDNILISSMISIITVGYYSNYSMIIGYIQTFLSQITTALHASIGNMLATASKEYSYNILKKSTLLLHFLTSFCAVCLFVLLTPFVRIWLGEDYTLDIMTVFWCVLSFYLQTLKTPLWYSINGVGYFRKDRNIAIYGAVSNLAVSFLAAKLWGLPGVFFGTVFSQATQWIFKTKIFVKDYVEKKIGEYLCISGGLTALTMLLAVTLYCGVDLLGITNLYMDFFVRLVACLIIPNGVNWLLFRKTEAFVYCKNLVVSKGKAIFKKVKPEKT